MHAHLCYAYTSVLCMHICAMHTDLCYAYTSVLCMHICAMHAHLCYAYTSVLCMHICAMHTHLCYACTSVQCMHICAMHVHGPSELIHLHGRHKIASNIYSKMTLPAMPAACVCATFSRCACTTLHRKKLIEKLHIV